jgi:phosphoglycerate dehydrogenase-like enzyme/tRNA A-37 threonylcarbamoyl transferase component Bud32
MRKDTGTATALRKVVLTDHPWPDVGLERSIIEGAGYELIVGPQNSPDPSVTARLVADADPDAILTCWAPVDARAVRAAGRLKIVARLGVGLDNIAVDAATGQGAWVTNVPDYCVDEVSDHALAMLLAHTRAIVPLDRAVKASGWNPGQGPTDRVSDLVIGIVGFGRIGRATARKLGAFGCRILVTTSSGLAEADAAAGVEHVQLSDLQRHADVLTLHLPLTDRSRGLFDYDFFRQCARHPLLINVSRGELVDNQGLLRALREGLVRGAALDVVAGEPSPDPALLSHEAVIVTPHVAYLSAASVSELRRRACEEVIRVLAGEAPRHPCNRPRAGGADCGGRLSGGVASDLEIRQAPDGPVVVKRALSKLRVQADWFADPGRSLTEAEALRAAADLLGADAVPEVLSVDPAEHAFTMRLVDSRFRNWKQDLLAGRVDQATAGAAGSVLGLLHTRSARQPELRARFGDQTYFQQLRIGPYFERVAERAPGLRSAIRDVTAGMVSRRSALVHGDYSPKNILADGSRIVILDWEVAHWGDPRFDVAFCLTHLLLKARRQNADDKALTSAASQFLTGYAETGPAVLDDALYPIAGCLLLARLDGDSPVEYIADLDTGSVRRLAASFLRGEADGHGFPRSESAKVQ